MTTSSGEVEELPDSKRSRCRIFSRLDKPEERIDWIVLLRGSKRERRERYVTTILLLVIKNSSASTLSRRFERNSNVGIGRRARVVGKCHGWWELRSTEGEQLNQS